MTVVMHGPLHRFFSADHRRLDALLGRSVAEPGEVDLAPFGAFRAGILRHIGMEEKVLFVAARRARGGEPLDLAARLRVDHGAIAALLVPTPTPALVAEILSVLGPHNRREEEPGGVYDACDEALGPAGAEQLAEARSPPRLALDCVRARHRSEEALASRLGVGAPVAGVLLARSRHELRVRRTRAQRVEPRVGAHQQPVEREAPLQRAAEMRERALVAGVDKQFGARTAVSLFYTGSRGRQLPYHVNQNIPEYQTGWPSEDAFYDARPNNNGRFADVRVLRHGLTSTYDAGTIRVNHRATAGLTFMAHYTYSKTVTDGRPPAHGRRAAVQQAAFRGAPAELPAGDDDGDPDDRRGGPHPPLAQPADSVHLDHRARRLRARARVDGRRLSVRGAARRIRPPAAPPCARRAKRATIQPPAPTWPVSAAPGGDTRRTSHADRRIVGRELADAIAFANEAAALSVTRLGAQASIPTRDEVEALHA